MGRALITANIGAGLYRATPQYDFTRIDLELLALNAASDQYWVTINAAPACTPTAQNKEFLELRVAK